MKINEILNENKILKLKEFCETQYNKFNENGYEDFEFVTFEFDGMSIINPFLDYTGMFEVDPVEEYGDSFLNSDFLKMNFLK